MTGSKFDEKRVPKKRVKRDADHSDLGLLSDAILEQGPHQKPKRNEVDELREQVANLQQTVREQAADIQSLWFHIRQLNQTGLE